MTVITTVIFVFFVAASISARSVPDDWQEIDFSQVISIENVAGFWDNKKDASDLLHQKTSLSRFRRIYGGAEVVPNSHPYQIVLFISISPTLTSYCGGTVLSTRAVLTAAHCIDRFPSVTVVAGAHNIHQLELTQQRIVATTEHFRVHPGWGKRVFDDDIGIVILPSALVFNAFVTPTRLPTGLETETFVGEVSRVIGWGITGPRERPSSVLRKAYNKVISNAECARVFPSEIIESTLCTATIGQGACSSDSGGSLTVTRPGDSRPIQIGIVSFGAECGVQLPSGFVRVTSYLTWIEDNKSP